MGHAGIFGSIKLWREIISLSAILIIWSLALLVAGAKRRETKMVKWLAGGLVF